MAARTKTEENYYDRWRISSYGLDDILDRCDGKINTEDMGSI